jgi:hypothetical protein
MSPEGCSGFGKRNGHVVLRDGRFLYVLRSTFLSLIVAERKFARYAGEGNTSISDYLSRFDHTYQRGHNISQGDMSLDH